MPANALRMLITPMLLVLATSAAYAEIYRWTDEEGVTHYTDTPRQGGADKEWTRPELANSPMELPEPGTWKPERKENEGDDEGHEAAREKMAAKERRCEEYEERLDQVNEELGRGYREPRGNKLRAERRELRSKMFSEC
ncbi:MAG: DUF4124 domain-containing protein [Pseudomonadota bacterium]